MSDNERAHVAGKTIAGKRPHTPPAEQPQNEKVTSRKCKIQAQERELTEFEVGLKSEMEKSFKAVKQEEELDLARLFPKEVLKRKLFTNAHAIRAIRMLIKEHGVEVCESMPYVIEGMENLLQLTRGIYTRVPKADKAKE